MLQTVNQTATAVVLKDKTVERANITAQRIGSLEIAIVKAVMLEQLDAKLADNQLAHIIFQKKNGSLREMWCSTNPSLCSKHVKGVHREHYGTKVVFDVEKGEFRSFRFESIIKVF